MSSKKPIAKKSTIGDHDDDLLEMATLERHEASLEASIRRSARTRVPIDRLSETADFNPAIRANEVTSSSSRQSDVSRASTPSIVMSSTQGAIRKESTAQLMKETAANALTPALYLASRSGGQAQSKQSRLPPASSKPTAPFNLDGGSLHPASLSTQGTPSLPSRKLPSTTFGNGIHSVGLPRALIVASPLDLI